MNGNPTINSRKKCTKSNSTVITAYLSRSMQNLQHLVLSRM